MPRTYRIVIDIASTDKGPSEATQVVHNVTADNLQVLLEHANDVVTTFAAESSQEMHERLVAIQNKGPADADRDSD